MFLAEDAIEEPRHPPLLSLILLILQELLCYILLRLRLLRAEIIFIRVEATHQLLTRKHERLALTLDYHEIVCVCLIAHIFPFRKNFRCWPLKFKLPVNEALEESKLLGFCRVKISAFAYLRMSWWGLILIYSCADIICRCCSSCKCRSPVLSLRNMTILPVGDLILQSQALCLRQLALGPGLRQMVGCRSLACPFRKSSLPISAVRA